MREFTMKRFVMLFCIMALLFAVAPFESFAGKPATYYTLTVASVNPTSGVAITVSPNDRNGAGSGSTQFTRSYAKGTVVTLTAPASSTGGSFSKWQQGTADYATTLTTTVTMSANTTMTAVFASSPHANLTYSGYPTSCMASSCHLNKFNEMAATNHYKWTGSAPDNVNEPGIVQGKLTNSLNSYCINILGDWPACGACHVGRGKRPDDSTAGLSNIDCLVCHNEEYATQRVRLADGSMGVLTPTDTMVRNMIKPTRKTCLQCHAKGGGGDAYKRGDLSLATITNTSASFDVHMNTTGSNLACQSCHVFNQHKVIGKGSDLRVTDDLTRGPEVYCTTCHTGMDSGTGHAAAGATKSEGDRHVKRVACQSCHIPTYAKVATEIDRDWRIKHDGRDATTCTSTNPCPGHPLTTKAANLIPVYRFWNRLSDSYLLGDIATLTYNPATNTYPTSTPLGDITDGMLTPFKYKTADQPIGTGTKCKDKLIALDTFVYLKGTGNVLDAVASGLTNMGCSGESYSWITTDTYQMINHGANPAAGYTACSQCHGNLRNNLDTTTDSMLDKLGYKLKGPQSQICNQCHSNSKTPRGHESMHGHINKTAGGSTGIGCYFCHNVARPERGKCSPCEPCASNYVDTVAYPHVCPTPAN